MNAHNKFTDFPLGCLAVYWDRMLIMRVVGHIETVWYGGNEPWYGLEVVPIHGKISYPINYDRKLLEGKRGESQVYIDTQDPIWRIKYTAIGAMTILQGDHLHNWICRTVIDSETDTVIYTAPGYYTIHNSYETMENKYPNRRLNKKMMAFFSALEMYYEQEQEMFYERIQSRQKSILDIMHA